MIEIQAPNPGVTGPYSKWPHIFLGGSIEMGTAEKWQDKVVADFANEDVIILNPRRDDWDASWVQEASNAQFSQQVNWELNNLEAADIKIFYFDPKTQSPITLLELGLHANFHPGDESTNTATVIVCCPKGYWRRGNVEIVCKREGIDMVEDYESLIVKVREAINRLK